MSNYEPEFKNKMIHLHLEDGRTIKSLQEEYGVSKASISIWIKEFRKECQADRKAGYKKRKKVACDAIADIYH